jgi:hypothetical protein
MDRAALKKELRLAERRMVRCAPAMARQQRILWICKREHRPTREALNLLRDLQHTRRLAASVKRLLQVKLNADAPAVMR